LTYKKKRATLTFLQEKPFGRLCDQTTGYSVFADVHRFSARSLQWLKYLISSDLKSRALGRQAVSPIISAKPTTASYRTWKSESPSAFLRPLTASGDFIRMSAKVTPLRMYTEDEPSSSSKSGIILGSPMSARVFGSVSSMQPHGEIIKDTSQGHLETRRLSGPIMSRCLVDASVAIGLGHCA